MELIKFCDDSNNYSEFNKQIYTIENKEKIKFIKYGSYHVMIVTDLNNIYGCGDNEDGQLGGKGTSLKFTKIEFKENIKYLECSNFFTMILNDKNELFGTGFLQDIVNKEFYNEFQKIETTDINGNIILVKGGYTFILILTENNDIYTIGNNNHNNYRNNNLTLFSSKFTKLINFKEKIKDIQCGYYHSVILDNYGNIYSFGMNYMGQLGLNDRIDRLQFEKVNLSFKVVKVVCFKFETIILNEYNEIFETGSLTNDKLISVFTKINLNNTAIYCNIFVGIDCLAAVSLENDIYFYGKDFGKNFLKLVKKDNKKHLFVVPYGDDDLFLFYSDYKINEFNIVDCDLEKLQYNCLQKFINQQMTDISFLFNNYQLINTKKRKLNTK